MAMAKSVVSTSLGIEGVDLVGGRDVAVADDASTFAATIIALLDDAASRARLGAAARQLSIKYDWSRLLPLLTNLYDKAVK